MVSKINIQALRIMQLLSNYIPVLENKSNSLLSLKHLTTSKIIIKYTFKLAIKPEYFILPSIVFLLFSLLAMQYDNQLISTYSQLLTDFFPHQWYFKQKRRFLIPDLYALFLTRQYSLICVLLLRKGTTKTLMKILIFDKTMQKVQKIFNTLGIFFKGIPHNTRKSKKK